MAMQALELQKEAFPFFALFQQHLVDEVADHDAAKQLPPRPLKLPTSFSVIIEFRLYEVG